MVLVKCPRPVPEIKAGRPEPLDGVWLWTLPDTPNGLRPTQSWHATASSSSGDIYVAGTDHKTNAALYRLDWRTGKLRLVGDARSASEAVGNWKPGETARNSTRGRFCIAARYTSRP
jgi:hypothetical protein